MPSRLGQYLATTETVEGRRFFPKRVRHPDGSTETIKIPVYHCRHHLHLTSSGRTTTFTHYLHRGQWGWRDERDGTTWVHAIRSEIARLCYRGNERLATLLMALVERGATL